jgi:filamentous hemagglutinin family protein
MIQKHRIKLLYCLSSISLSGTIAILPATAQITGDGTIGTQVNGSIVVPCTGNCRITNGATRGGNLFHSFQRFSLPNGDIANFQISPTIQNVIVRVTGVGQPFISNLNGTIQTSNPANFFLLNPNGILFGPRATLNIGGSFLATTADRMQFADGTQFRTTDPTPLLSINVPTGLQFNNNPGTIQMQRSVLSVGEGDNFRNFALVGGEVKLTQSSIRAPRSQVAIGSVGENGSVVLQLQGDRLSLSLAAGTPRRDITLTDTRINTATTTGGSSIILTARNIILNDSFIGTGITAGVGNSATQKAGDITLNATEDVRLLKESQIANSVRPNAIGQGGNINLVAAHLRAIQGSVIAASTEGRGNSGNVEITTNSMTLDGVTADGTGGTAIGNGVFGRVAGEIRRGGTIVVKTGLLSITNGASINGTTFGTGNAGNVRIIADSITIDGTTPNGSGASSIGSSVNRNANGNGGSVVVETRSIKITNGASINANTFGTGNAGSVRVIADSIVLDGETADGRGASGISSSVNPTGTGRGGEVTVQTRSLMIMNGAGINAATGGNGNAGNVQVKASSIILDGTARDGSAGGISSQVISPANGNGGEVFVDTDSLSIKNGSVIAASTSGNGNAGNVNIIAKTITVDGRSPNGKFATGITSQVKRTGIGVGGNVVIGTDSLTVSNGATVNSSSLGKGSAGKVDITARTLKLDSGNISTLAFSGNGADIKLTVGQRLEMRRGSQISTSAGLAGAGGDGGNITIDAKNAFLVTAPNENNDITANAFNGSGGRVTIETQGIYGFTVRSRAELAALLNTNDPNKLDPSLLPSNDITAISQGNPILNGSVNINVLNLDPSRGLLTLPIDRIDPAQQIAQACQPSGKQARGSFVMVGQGGLPPNPIGVLSSETLITRLSGESIGQPVFGLSTESFQATPNSVTEINSWIVEPDGTVKLVAIVPGVESNGFGHHSRFNC